jgi:hypothetical protein
LKKNIKKITKNKRRRQSWEKKEKKTCKTSKNMREKQMWGKTKKKGK